MDLNIAHIWATMGLAARMVVFVLSAMAITTLAVTIERLLAMLRWRREAASIAGAVAGSLRERRYGELLEVTLGNRHPLPRLVHAGVSTYTRALSAPSEDVTPVELARRELARTMELVSADTHRGLSALASVASVAPFVGLFGTVIGIITAFEGIAKTGSGGLGAVSAGIAEALIVTAMGLAVAIPAVLLFNFLTTQIDRFDLALQTATGELVDQLETNHGSDRRQRLAA